ncbi:uncharacterized protein LOC113464063 isoform X2 [Ceratina calcarata]|uniref:Uncharacterized protein LOC113464063 isoform X2 n=1 Tax=Ceratina calcarata TaxID=156304 RepID=A0AAJ7RXM1_9HYME|nr:uncharacterized protein LOC113464063 isoform X2 [Ceratina calcarata]
MGTNQDAVSRLCDSSSSIWELLRAIFVDSCTQPRVRTRSERHVLVTCVHINARQCSLAYDVSGHIKGTSRDSRWKITTTGKEEPSIGKPSKSIFMGISAKL